MISINMMSKADTVKGQGVLSAHDEQLDLVKNQIGKYDVKENSMKRCDITHFHTINPEYLCMVPFLKKNSKTVAYVHFVPETLEGSLKLAKPIKGLFYKYVIKFYDSMDKLVVVNPYFIDVLSNYGINREKIKYIPNYVSEEKFYSLDESVRKDARKEYNIDKDSFVVLAVGQLQTRKGVLDFIEIAEKHPEIEFVWAGDAVFGNMTQGYNVIKEKIDSGLAKNIHFIGLVDREKMNSVYNMADVMFLPSYEELFPMSILEAMCINMPVLTRKLDIYKDILFDFCVNGETNEEFENTIVRLKNDKDYYNQCCLKAKEGNQFYSREHVSDIWREFYDGLVDLEEKN